MNHPVLSYRKKTTKSPWRKVWPQKGWHAFPWGLLQVLLYQLLLFLPWSDVRRTPVHPERCTWQSSQRHVSFLWIGSSITWVHRDSGREMKIPSPIRKMQGVLLDRSKIPIHAGVTGCPSQSGAESGSYIPPGGSSCPDRDMVVFNRAGLMSFTVLHFWHSKK